MITFKQGNLLEADAEALVNTVNTVGIMGKGIALMFKECFPQNFEAYAHACKIGDVRIGKMFVTENLTLFGPKWIINFPTKTDWRVKTKLKWVEDGLLDLVHVIREKEIRSIAVPPLGCGNGGLRWPDVRRLITSSLEEVEGVEVVAYIPTRQYQNVAKREGVEKLTPARALVAEMVRRYCLIGIDCSLLEVQKLAWFIERGVRRFQIDDPLNFHFSADKYGPYSHNLVKLLDGLDGSYLSCDKRLADAGPLDLIWFNDSKRERVNLYFNSEEDQIFAKALEWASFTTDGFESPLGMELLATVDWMVRNDGVASTVEGVMAGLSNWKGGDEAGRRKLKIFDERLISLALERLDKANELPV